MSERVVEDGMSLEELVGRVADEYTARLRAGQRPDVEEYAARYPHAAALLRARGNPCGRRCTMP